jgi:hypothetical protein
VRRYEEQVKGNVNTNGNGCPVPKNGTGRYKFKFKDNTAGGTPALRRAAGGQKKLPKDKSLGSDARPHRSEVRSSGAL